MEQWLKKSWFFQQSIYKNVKDRYWEDLEEEMLRDKVKYALCICYGELHLETDEFKSVPEKIVKKILNHSQKGSKEKIFFSCTFINVWLIDDEKEKTECVFFTRNKDNNLKMCVDTNCREYDSWLDFIENNKLPECHIIFPKAGIYADETGSDLNYRELICEESVACGLKAKIKKSLDVAATVGACAAFGVLAFNPVSLPVTIAAIATSVVGGVISTGFAVERLVDKSVHEGLGLDYQSIFAVSDVALSALSVAAVGVTGGCKLLASSEKFLFNGAMMLKITSSSGTVCNALTVIGGVFINIIFEFRQKMGIVSLKSLKLLQLTINFIYCIKVSLKTVKELVEYISKQSLDDVITSLSQQSNRIYSYIKTGLSISDDFNTLVQLIIPRVVPIMRKITDSGTVKFLRKVFEDIKQRDNKDPLTLLYNMMTQLPEVMKEIDKFHLESKQKLENNFGKETYRIIGKWTSNDVIDVGHEHSSYEDKINLPVNVINKAHETVTSLVTIKNKKTKTKLLFDSVMKLIIQHDLKSYTYAIGEAKYYCEKFSEIYSKVMDYIHYEYFLYSYKNGRVDLEHYFEYGLELKEDLANYVFEETLKLLSKCANHLHAEYDFMFQNSSHEDSSEESESVFKFKVPKGNLNEKLCYDTAVEHLPSLSSKLTKDRTIFESHFDQLFIITSNVDKFKLIFYVIENGENLDGLLMYVK